jgi:excinuclease ABC subunit B
MATLAMSIRRSLAWSVLGRKPRLFSPGRILAVSSERFSTDFQVTADFEPTGDQPAAIHQLVHQVESGDRCSLLRGVTGSGKTLVMSHVISRLGKPALVLCHNKTLAAQLARELRSFLSHTTVELFVSHYNHYRPEFVSETTGTYMTKKSSINPDLDTLRHCATRALLTRRDVVVVASVSCIYGLGLPKDYLEASTELQTGQNWDWDEFLQRLDGMLFEQTQTNVELERGNYQVTDLQQKDGKYKDCFLVAFD